MMNKQQIKSLKARAHSLKPTVLIGAKGLTDAVLAETDIALEAHELIKIKVAGAEREDRKPLFLNLCAQLSAELIQILGNTATVYRQKQE